jgi:pimeloyl-ACP methyl ester carboxylesterase
VLVGTLARHAATVPKRCDKAADGPGAGTSLAGVLRTLAGGALFGEAWGEGAPQVVALHGWRRTHADFAASLGPGSPRGSLPVLAPDLPGHGATPPPAEAWGSEAMAQAVAPLLAVASDGGDAGPVVLVGHSLGGRVAVRLAAAFPELVGALVLCAAPLVPRTGRARRPALALRGARALHGIGLVSEDRLERVRRRHGSADYNAAHGVMRDVLVRLVNERYDDALAALGCPVELLWGDDDLDVPVGTAHALAERIPGSHLELVPGGGHLLPVHAPEAVRDAVERAMTRRT